MSTVPKPLTDLSPEPETNDLSSSVSVALFTPKLQTLWALVILLTVAPELLPIGHMHRLFFLLYYAVKVASFLSLGFFAPLALRSLNGIGLGMILSFLSAFFIEAGQGLLHNGHVFHWYELVGKLTLIALGFALGLDSRYELKLALGPLKVNFLGDRD